MKDYLQRILLAGILTVVSLQQNLHGQESPLERAMLYPPELWNKGESETQLAVIEWKSVQLQSRNDGFLRQLEKLNLQKTEVEAMIAKVVEQIPMEQRVLDSRVRADLAGGILEDLIRVRLDVVANEAAIAELERQAEKSGTQANRVEAINVEAAKLECDLARTRFEKVKRLVKTGAVSTAEAAQAEYQVKIAGLKLKKATVDLENAAGEAGAQVSERLVDHRIELKAAKSRIAAAEEMLGSLAAAEGAVANIKSAQLVLEDLRNDRRQLAADMASAGRQIEQLKSLKKLIVKRSPAKVDETSSNKKSGE